MTEMNDKILDASRALFDENLNMAKTVAASQGSKRIVENAQLRSSEDLHKFLERYEQNQKEQAAENEKNKKLAIRSFWVSIAATVFGGGSLIVAIIALALQLSKWALQSGKPMQWVECEEQDSVVPM